MPTKQELNKFLDSFNNDITESELQPDPRAVELANQILKSAQSVKLSNTVDRKFEESFKVSDYLINTDDGWEEINNIGKTIEYEVWEVKTENGYTIIGADNHIVFDYDWDEIFLKNLNKDTRPDYIITEKGPSRVTSVKCLGYSENMYDLEVGSNKHRFWSNGILSHNSIWLANDASHFFRQGKNVAVISAEMSEKKFMKRIGANILDEHIDGYEKLANDTNKLQSKIQYVMDDPMMPPGDLHVKQMPAPTVPEVEMYLKEYEDKTGVNLDVIVVDYINILTNYRNPNSENTYLKVKQIAEDLRSMAIRNDWIIITATQITRGAWNSSNVTMGDIAESAGLAHTADTIFAIIQDNDMLQNNEYWLKILKIRDGGGKNTKCLFAIDYSRMRITETNDVIQNTI